MEGPSLVIMREEATAFTGKKVIEVSGYANIDMDRIVNQRVIEFKTWGKHFLVVFKKFTLRIHFGLFGSYTINKEREGRNPTLKLVFPNGEINCYVARVKIIEEPLEDIYDWSVDMLDSAWRLASVKKLVKQEEPTAQIGDLLLNPRLFSGVGNIIRNEVLYRVRLHPETLLQAVPEKLLTATIRETKTYSEDFLRWKKEGTLKRHWEVYTKKNCPLGHPVEKKYTGKTERRSFICKVCQVKYK